MLRIQFSELQYHIVCWIGTFIQPILLPPSSGQKMEAPGFLKTFVPLCKTMVCHIQEDSTHNVCHIENFRSHLGNLLIGWVAVGICIGNGLLCNLEFIFSSMRAIMSVRMYWMRQCVSGGDRRVVDPETNLCWPHLLRLVSSLCSSRPWVPVGKCTTPSYHIWLPALYAGLNKPIRLLIFDVLKMKAEWKYHWIINIPSCSGFLHRCWTLNHKLFNPYPANVENMMSF